jgi:hypothetical protein
VEFALRHLERLRLALVDTRAGDRQLPGGRLPPISITTQRERRGVALRGAGPALDHYGFAAFGDAAERVGFASGRGDLVRGLLRAYLTQGERAFRSRGLELARHRADFDQYHCADVTGPGWAWRNGFQRFAAGAHGDLTTTLFPQGEAPPSPADTWIEGLYLAHALTGDLRCLDVARDGLEAFLALTGPDGGLLDRAQNGPDDLSATLPLLANAMDQLLAAYEWTGDARALEAAVRVFRRRVVGIDVVPGEGGGLRIPGPCVDLLPVVTLLRPLARLHAELQRSPRAAERATAAQSLALLVRVVAYLCDEGLRGTGEVVGGLYVPALLPRTLGDAAPFAEPYAPYGGRLADACAYVYAQTHETRFRDLSLRVLRDSVLFQQAPVRGPLSPAFHAPASFTGVRHAGDAVLSASLLTNGFDVAVSVLSAEGVTGPREGLLAVYGPEEPGALRALRVASQRGGNLGDGGSGPAAPPRAHDRDDAAVAALPTPEPVVQDDGEAEFAGAWSAHRNDSAMGGEQRVSLDPERPATATWTLAVGRGGTYRVSLRWGNCAGAATDTPVRVEHADGVESLRVNQSVNAGEWRLVGEFRLLPAAPLVVRVDRTGTRGAVVADAVRVEWVR